MTVHAHLLSSRDKVSWAVRGFLETLGVDLSDPHLIETPHRVAGMFRDELLVGYSTNVAELFKTFEERCRDTVVVSDVSFFSLCAHHLLPFYGTATIAYQANERVIGLSKLARLVECFARRLQIQERLTAQVADALMEHLMPHGALVHVRATHLCMEMRGVSKPGTVTTTCAVRGVFETDEKALADAWRMVTDSRKDGR